MGGERRDLSSEESPSLGLEPRHASFTSALSHPITGCSSERTTLPLSVFQSPPERVSLAPSQAVSLTPEEDREGSPDCWVENRALEWPWGADYSPDGQDEKRHLAAGPVLCPLRPGRSAGRRNHLQASLRVGQAPGTVACKEGLGSGWSLGLP